MADPVTAEPEETRAPPSEAPVTALRLLRRHDFRNVFLAVSASEVGGPLHHIALMWVAIETAAPLGVVAVRLADSVPALVFGLHGGVAADRRNRRNMTVAADLARGATLVPIAVAGLTGQLPLWGPRRRVVSARERHEPLRAGPRRARPDARRPQGLSIGGWALAAGLLAVLRISTFFALDAASFFLSAFLISRVHRPRGAVRRGPTPPGLCESYAALRPFPTLAAGVVALGVAVTISSGTWIAGVPTLVRDHLHAGAGGFSLVTVGYAAGRSQARSCSRGGASTTRRL